MATTSALPLVIDALIVKAQAGVDAGPIGSVTVSDGIPVTYERNDWLMVGVQDPDIDGAQQAATASQDWEHAGGQTRHELGEVVCAVYVQTGDTELKIVRDRAFLIIDAFAAQLRIDKTLGLEQLVSTSFGTQTVISQAQDGQGVHALVVFRVGFLAWLTL